VHRLHHPIQPHSAIRSQIWNFARLRESRFVGRGSYILIYRCELSGAVDECNLMMICFLCSRAYEEISGHYRGQRLSVIIEESGVALKQAVNSAKHVV
jgi:hypothetical protein